MKIDATTSPLNVSQRSRESTHRTAATSFSAALAEAQAGGTRQPDFTRMTRQEMRDWTNTQIRSGQMSLDESRPFMAMTMNVPTAGAFATDVTADGDGTRYDFAQKARDGIQGALLRNDETTRKMLESAMSIMLQRQGQAIGVDTRA